MNWRGNKRANALLQSINYRAVSHQNKVDSKYTLKKQYYLSSSIVLCDKIYDVYTHINKLAVWQFSCIGQYMCHMWF